MHPETLSGVEGCHTDEGELGMLWAAVTAGAQADARQQIVGPDNPEIPVQD